jgi:hypothetical protein
MGTDPRPSVPDSKKASRKRKAQDSPAGPGPKRTAQEQNSSPLAHKGNPKRAPEPNSKQPKAVRGRKPQPVKYPLSTDTILNETDSDADQDPAAAQLQEQLTGGLDSGSPPGFPPEQSDAEYSSDSPRGHGPRMVRNTFGMQVDQPGPKQLAARPTPVPDGFSHPAPFAGHGLVPLFGKDGPFTSQSAHLVDHPNTSSPGSPGLKLTPDMTSPATPDRQVRHQRPSDIAQGSGQRRLSPIPSPGAGPRSLYASPKKLWNSEQRKAREQRVSLREQKAPGPGASGDADDVEEDVEEGADQGAKDADEDAKESKTATKERKKRRKLLRRRMGQQKKQGDGVQG